MGFFSYLPFMECNHGVLSMNHSLKGSISVDGSVIDFSGGTGYIEKDWGRSFPKSYTWMQSNHFKKPDVSFFCATADIPIGKMHFKGLIANLRAEDTEYRFATYNGSKLKMDVFTDRLVRMTISNSKHTLYIEGCCEDSQNLAAPHLGMMNHIIKEGLSGVISLKLTNRSGQILLDTSSVKSGMELVPAMKQ
jgi:hypothetical protein